MIVLHSILEDKFYVLKEFVCVVGSTGQGEDYKLRLGQVHLSAETGHHLILGNGDY